MVYSFPRQVITKFLSEKQKNTYQYVFNYSDHLGNNRVSYTFDPAAPAPGLVILEKSNYYPYGLRHMNYNMDWKQWTHLTGQTVGIGQQPLTEQFEAPGKHKYKYNGKEWQGDFGYNMYDMPLRDYDPAIGRWVVLDPVIHHSQSTYSSFNGNPVLFVDPSGGRGQMLDRNGANMFDENGNYIWHADREVPGEVSMAAYGSGGSTVEKMINKINGLSDAKKATLPPPHVLLQMLIDEANAGGDWEGMLEEVISNTPDGDPPMNQNTPKRRQIGPPTPAEINGAVNPLAFNCNSYAWHNSKGDPSDPGNVGAPPLWDNDPYRDTGGYHMIPFSEANQVGDRLVYYAWDEKKQRPSATHSAIVVEVNSKGEATLVSSKWGEGPLYIHHPRDVHAIYGSPNPTYRAPNGKIYQSRIYFRKN